MSVVSRTFRSIPYRSAAETWRCIVDLLAPPSGEVKLELESVAGAACSLIAEERMHEFPIVVSGSGPRIRIYCLYNEDALEADKASETALSFVAAQGDWKLSLPAPESDLAWVQKTLKSKSSRITARKQDAAIDEAADSVESSKSALSVNLEALKKL